MGVLLQQAKFNHLNRCRKKKTLSPTQLKIKKLTQANKTGRQIVYIIHCTSAVENFFKIGFTSWCVKDRYPSKKSMPYDMEILFEEDVENGISFEQYYHYDHSNETYQPIRKFGGSKHECYLHNPLEHFEMINRKLVYKKETITTNSNNTLNRAI